MKKLTIYENDGKFDVYEESGGSVEVDFETFDEAKQWIKDNGYKYVETFNL